MFDIWELTSILVSFLLYLGVLAGTGLMLNHIVFSRETSSIHGSLVRWARAFALIALLSSFLDFALKGAELTGEASGMIDPVMLGLLWITPVGSAFVLCVAGLALMLSALIFAPKSGQWVACVGGGLAIWSFSRVGHIAAAEPIWLSFVLLLHLLCVAFWIGILLPLRKLAGDQEDLRLAADLGYRFGQIAAYSVPALIAAGIIMAWHLVGDFSSLVTTSYGLVLLAKASVVGLLLAVAATNKLRLVPAMRSGDGNAAIHLRRTIVVEWFAVCLILLATASLTNLPAGGVS